MDMTTLLECLPNRVKWTVDEFDHLTELGAFDGRKIELLNGEFSEKMSQNEPHARAIVLLQYKLIQLLPANRIVRVQVPLQLETSKPEPDVAVIAGSLRDPLEMPTTALLAIEISDTTLQTDRDVKTHIYARAGVEEYWIVDLNARRVEVRREPRADATQPLGFGYRTVLYLNDTDTLAPLAAPDVSLAIADILP